MSDLRPWVRALQGVIAQGIELVLRLDEADYRESAQLMGASVGAHLRHQADFLAAFLRGWPARAVDYDARDRDERLEREPARAVAWLRRLSDQLGLLEGLDPRSRLRVRMEASPSGERETAWQDSSLGREIVFLLSHTIHHQALIAAALRARGLDPGSDLGVAPSTLQHRSATERCAPRAG